MPKDHAAIDFESLEYFCRIYQERGRRAMGELAPAIAESMHALVLEEFETEGHGQWPGFWWQRAGLPKPGSAKAGPVRRGGDGRKRDRRLLGRGKLAKSNRRWQGEPKLLQDTGVLVGSLTPNWNDELVEVYTNVPYAKYHVSPEPRHKIPLRDFFAIDAAAFEQDVIDMLDLHLRRPIAAE
jgi:phage gpG-like protein